MSAIEIVFTESVMDELFPPERANDFFEALFGAAEEGAFDIKLAFKSFDTSLGQLVFTFDLHERPGCCLACNLTYGLPEVFSRHPVINVNGLVKDIEKKIGGAVVCESWKLGTTHQHAKQMHSIPLTITVSTP